MYPKAILNLMETLKKLPSVGRKTAEKYAFEILNWEEHNRANLVLSLQQIASIQTCTQCFNFSEGELCSICSQPNRDKKTICVIANYADLLAIESIGEYKGLYHILRGTINQVEGVTPEKLTINALEKRIKTEGITEVILALNPDIPGETTLMYLQRILNKYDVAVSRIARGLPMGSSLEYADHTTLSNALKGRQSL
jgi:recombination protein RecR